MSTSNANVFYQLLQQFNQKANPPAPSQNVSNQKFTMPTDSASTSDGANFAIVGTGFYKTSGYAQSFYAQPPAMPVKPTQPASYYGQDKYSQATYGGGT